MSCELCQPLIESRDDERERTELKGVFEIIDEKVDKYDSCTMWWYGTARCSRCSQQISFEYMSGYQNTGRITARLN